MCLVRDPTSSTLPYTCNPSSPNPVAGSSATPCYRLRTYDPSFVQRLGGWGIGGFIQDVWKPTAWLTVTPGLRVDYGIYHNTSNEVVQNLLGFGPRLSAVVDVTRDGKTLLKLAYGRANDINTLLLTSYADKGPQELDWSYNRSTGRFDKFYGASFGDGGYDLRGRCPDGRVALECGNAKLSLSPPYSDSVIVSLEREVSNNVMASVTYTFRYMGYQWERIELNALRTLDGGDYAAFGDKTKGSVSAYRPMADAFRRYNGVDIAVSGTPSPRWFFYLAYTLSFLDGTIEDVVGTELQGAVGWDPPRNLRLYGYLPDDHRHQVKSQVSYAWRGFSAGLNLTYLSGAPMTRLYSTPIDYVGRFAWRGIDPGADPNDVRKWSELRSPDYFNLDLRVQYDLNEVIKRGHHLSLIVDLFNVLNLSAPIDPNTLAAGFENRNTPSYGTVTNRQTPFRAQFALRYHY